MSEPVTTWVVTANGTQELLLPSGEGTEGPAGPPGADGVDGVDGADGADGAPGATGATGATGPAGSTVASGVTFSPTGTIAATDVQAAIAEVASEAAANAITTGTYTPTLTGMVVGTGGTNTATYTVIGSGSGRMMFLDGCFTFGTSGQTFPTNPNWTLPAGFSFTSRGGGAQPMGQATFYDVTGTIWIGSLWPSGTTGLRPLMHQLNGSNIAYNSLTTGSPFLWAAGDHMTWKSEIRIP